MKARVLVETSVISYLATRPSDNAVNASRQVELIASWNFRHIAGPVARRKINHALAEAGEFVPTIATPEEILESTR